MTMSSSWHPLCGKRLSSLMRVEIRIISVLLIMLWLSAALAAEQPWQPVGPDGGNVRSLAIDPKNPDRIFLGTSAGNLYLPSIGEQTGLGLPGPATPRRW